MNSSHIVKFFNGLLLKDGELVSGDLWVSAETGCILSPQATFYTAHLTPNKTIDLQGKIISPGFIDVQLNGGYGLDFSSPDNEYQTNLELLNQALVKSGVTSYLPTITSQLPEVYHKALPHLGASTVGDASRGAESLGAHVEGPFLSPARNGIHTLSILRKAYSWQDIEACYGKDNMPNICKITAAPEVANMISLIPQFVDHNIIFSIGHSDADLEQAQEAMSAGATMVTHMFNAMRPFGHRDPGILGLLGQSNTSTPLSSTNTSLINSPAQSPKYPKQTSSSNHSTHQFTLQPSTTVSDLSHPPPSSTPPTPAPYFGLIADGIHLSPSALKIAYTTHPHGAILVTDAMSLSGLPDSTYPGTNGEQITKFGPLLTLEKNGRIAGSAATMIQCINFFHHATGEDWAKCLRCATETPAKMVGVDDRKGRLDEGCDADLVVLSQGIDGDGREALSVEQVWKYGVRVAWG